MKQMTETDTYLDGASKYDIYISFLYMIFISIAVLKTTQVR